MFKRWPKIGQLSDVVDEPSEVVYKAKIKLHGTNTAINVDNDGTIRFQSRTRFITSESKLTDSFGFALWADTMFADVVKNKTLQHNTVIYGEWAGPNIVGRTDACCRLPTRMWFIFGALVGDVYVHDPSVIAELVAPLVKASPDQVRVLPYFDNGREFSLAEIEKTLATLLPEIEKQDPYIASECGIIGSGEGLVFVPCNNLRFERLIFKAKTEHHKEKRSAQVLENNNEEKTSNEQKRKQMIKDFGYMYVTPARCEKILSKLDSGTGCRVQRDVFVANVCEDVEEETVNDRKEITWDDVRPAVTKSAHSWYSKHYM